MSDNDKGTIARQSLNSLLNFCFCLHINRSGCFIEYQYWRISQQCPGYGQPLLLPARQQDTSFAYQRFIATGQRNDEIVDIGLFGSLNNFIPCGGRLAVGDIVGNRAVEQKNILGTTLI